MLGTDYQSILLKQTWKADFSNILTHTFFSLFSCLSCNIFPFSPSPLSLHPLLSPSLFLCGEPVHTSLLSPFHLEEQLLWQSSLCLSLSLSPSPLSLRPPLPHFLPALYHFLTSRGNHTVWTKCATNLSDGVCFPPLSHTSFFSALGVCACVCACVF